MSSVGTKCILLRGVCLKPPTSFRATNATIVLTLGDTVGNCAVRTSPYDDLFLLSARNLYFKPTLAPHPSPKPIRSTPSVYQHSAPHTGDTTQ